MKNIIAAALLSLLSYTTYAEEKCDLGLVLAMDVSGSVTTEEFKLQMEGTALAFRNERVARAIRSGFNHQIAVTVTNWASVGQAQVVVPWMLLNNSESIQVFSAAVLAVEKPQWGGSTGVGNALIHAHEQFSEIPCEAENFIIDISGDGANNNGPDPTQVMVIPTWVQVNALAILTDEPMLDEWYKKVVAPYGGFVIVANDFQDYYRAILAKLELEIAQIDRKFTEP